MTRHWCSPFESKYGWSTQGDFDDHDTRLFEWKWFREDTSESWAEWNALYSDVKSLDSWRPRGQQDEKRDAMVKSIYLWVYLPI